MLRSGGGRSSSSAWSRAMHGCRGGCRPSTPSPAQHPRRSALHAHPAAPPARSMKAAHPCKTLGFQLFMTQDHPHLETPSIRVAVLQSKPEAGRLSRVHFQLDFSSTGEVLCRQLILLALKTSRVALQRQRCRMKVFMLRNAEPASSLSAFYKLGSSRRQHTSMCLL